MYSACYPFQLYEAHCSRDESKTLEPAIVQQQRLTAIILKNNFVDRGYRGVKEVLGTKIIIPDKPGKTERSTKNKNSEKDLNAEQLLSPEQDT